MKIYKRLTQEERYYISALKTNKTYIRNFEPIVGKSPRLPDLREYIYPV